LSHDSVFTGELVAVVHDDARIDLALVRLGTVNEGHGAYRAFDVAVEAVTDDESEAVAVDRVAGDQAATGEGNSSDGGKQGGCRRGRRLRLVSEIKSLFFV